MGTNESDVARRPLITRISIRNFKGIGDDWVEIPLSPITLLFGANSAGKSTILHALHYAREIFERHNLNPDQTIAGGDFVDLGGFENFAHGHNLMEPVALSFELDLRDRQLPVYYTAGGQMTLSAYDIEDLMGTVTSASIEVHVKGNPWNVANPARAVRYAVAINGEPLAAMTAPVGSPDIELTEINYRNPVFTLTEVFDRLAQAAEEGGTSIHYSTWGVGEQADAIPHWRRALALSTVTEPGTVEQATPEMVESVIGFTDATIALFSRLIVGPGELLRNALCDMRYLGPLRELPGRDHRPPRFPDPGRWAGGLAAWDQLFESAEMRAHCNAWLLEPDRFDTGYSIELREFSELTDGERELLQAVISHCDDLDWSEIQDQCDGLLGSLAMGRRLVIEESRDRNIEFAPPDLGVGIAQLVPVAVAGVDPTAALTLIEQPELHLHPALQARLAELFISRANLGLGPVILETHSEHLILRILRRIRETHEGELPEGHPGLAPELVSVVYVEKQDGQVRVSKLRIDETGEFRDRWPKGFFEERAEELF